MKDGLGAIGLEVNSVKCELTILDNVARYETDLLFRAVLPNVRVVSKDNCSFLGAPLSDAGVPIEILRKKENLYLMISRLQVVDNHLAFVFEKCFLHPEDAIYSAGFSGLQV